MRYITFYTSGTIYAQEAERLQRSAFAVGVYVEAFALDDLGDWQENVAQKHSVIDSVVRQSIDPVVFIDADAVLHEDPTKYFEIYVGHNYDFAARFRKGRLQSGTMLWVPGDGADRLLDAWAKENQNRLDKGIRHGRGQAALQDALEKNKWWIRHASLRTSLCYIFDTDKEEDPDTRAIIEHLQASRVGNGDRHCDDQRARRSERIAEIENELGSKC